MKKIIYIIYRSAQIYLFEYDYLIGIYLKHNRNQTLQGKEKNNQKFQ